MDIEEIKQLKARYFRNTDTCNLELLQTVLADDVHIRADSPTYQYEINGIDEAMNFYRNAFTSRRLGMQNGHMLEIKIDGDTVMGIWYLNDLFINLDEQIILTGSALHEDCYFKVAGQWRVQRTATGGCWR